MVFTDIGGSDPDDLQSMVHYQVYADLFDAEGLIASPPHAGSKEHILEALEALPGAGAGCIHECWVTGYQSAASPGSSAHSKARRSSWSAAGRNARRRFGTVHRTDNLGMHGRERESGNAACLRALGSDNHRPRF